MYLRAGGTAAPQSRSCCGACLAAWLLGSTVAEAEHFESIATWTINNKQPTQLRAHHPQPLSTFPSPPPLVCIPDRGTASCPSRGDTLFPPPIDTAVAIALTMGKKKRGHPDVEELLGRPWCYYCSSTASLAGTCVVATC